MSNYAFIDSQNLNVGIRSLGWHLDWRKFRAYLQDEFNCDKAYIFIGYTAGNEDLYTYLQKSGYEIVFRHTLEHDGIVKGNTDAEMVLHTMIELNNYDKAVIVSGDGDFFSLVEYLHKNDKLERLLVPNRKYSAHLRNYDFMITRLDELKKELQYFSQHYLDKKNGVKTDNKPDAAAEAKQTLGGE